MRHLAPASTAKTSSRRWPVPHEALHKVKINIIERDRGQTLREKLRERLDRAAELRCAEHDQKIVSVTIHARENGWFDARWTTCCEALEKQAVAIVKTRC